MLYFQNVEVVLYPDQYPTLDSVEEICMACQTIKNYVIAFHDRDTKADGTAIEPHYHVYLKLKTSRAADIICGWFGVAENRLERVKGTYKNCCAYATHANAKSKYQYGAENVRANFDIQAYMQSLEDTLDNKRLIQTLCNEVMTGEKSIFKAKSEIVQSGEFDALSAQLDAAYKLYVATCRGKRNLEVLYIWGDSGTGKTRYAVDFCKSNGLDYYISSSHNDPFQYYGGEAVAILDDIRTGAFTFEEWLKLLDNHTLSAVQSRYHNKMITAKMIIITTPIHPLDFCDGELENLWQFYRRINGYMYFDYDTIKMYKPCLCDDYGQISMGDMIYEETNVYVDRSHYQEPNMELFSKLSNTYEKIAQDKLPYSGTQLSLFERGEVYA